MAEISFDKDEQYDPEMIIRPLYFVFEIASNKYEDILKRLRFILAMRTDIVKKIELDFKNNSFQKMIEEKNKKMLLSNWKNATHSDDWIYSDVIKSMHIFHKELKISKGNYPENIEDDIHEMKECIHKMEEYIYKMEGTVLRLLSDSNISSKYHASLTKDIDRKYNLNNENVYALTMPFRDSIIGQYLESLRQMPQRNNDEKGCRKINIDDRLMEKRLFYFVGEQEQLMLIIIPIIQNALKYCKYNCDVDIYYEKKVQNVLKGEGEKDIDLDYLCIRNPLAENKDGIAEQMKDYMEFPVGMRERSQLDSQNGISLYAVNKYLEKLIETIFNRTFDFKEPPLKIEQKDSSMIVKLPIIQGEIKRKGGDGYGKIYYC